MRSKKLKHIAERGIVSLTTPLATQKAPLRSSAGMDAPCDEEMEAVFDEVATQFDGTFNDFTDKDGTTQYDWQFHLPQGITIARMREVMTSLGFAEFLNLNLRSHHPTLPFDLGAFHWKGNVSGNWYHIEFRPTGRRRKEVYPVDAHYDADRPSFVFHRTAKGKRKC
ncbi:MAG: hypothetical protein ACMG6H_08075 [Acidobacteriota bacterium]